VKLLRRNLGRILAYFFLGGDHINHTSSAFLSYGTTHDAIHMTEIYEYVKSKKNQKFVLPFFQKCKLAHAKKLASLGLPERALEYCKCIQDIGNKQPGEGVAKAVEADVGDFIRHLSMAQYGTTEGLSQSVIGSVASAVTSGVTTGLSTGFNWLVGGSSKPILKDSTTNQSLQKRQTDYNENESPLPPRGAGGRSPVVRRKNGVPSVRTMSHSPVAPLVRTASSPVGSFSRSAHQTLRRGQSMRQVTRSSQNVRSFPPRKNPKLRPPQRTGSSPNLRRPDKPLLNPNSADKDNISNAGQIIGQLARPTVQTDILASRANGQTSNMLPIRPKAPPNPSGPVTAQDSGLSMRSMSRSSSAGRRRPRVGRRTARPRR